MKGKPVQKGRRQETCYELFLWKMKLLSGRHKKDDSLGASMDMSWLARLRTGKVGSSNDKKSEAGSSDHGY